MPAYIVVIISRKNNPGTSAFKDVVVLAIKGFPASGTLLLHSLKPVYL